MSGLNWSGTIGTMMIAPVPSAMAWEIRSSVNWLFTVRPLGPEVVPAMPSFFVSAVKHLFASAQTG